jgi:uncharacterized ubiquitin-like protein YukD
MIRDRVLATVLAAAGLLGVVGGARPDDGETPGVNDLRLQVERLERAEQADVTGAESSAMLFDPEHRAAVATADEARRRARSAVTTALFLGTGTSSRAPVPTAHLFDPEAYVRATRASEAPAGVEGSGWSAAPLGAVAALAGGAGVSAALRARGCVPVASHVDVTLQAAGRRIDLRIPTRITVHRLVEELAAIFPGIDEGSTKYQLRVAVKGLLLAEEDVVAQHAVTDGDVVELLGGGTCGS